MRDFYATLAQVMPVLLLALIWESRYLEKLDGQQRRSRRHDPAGGVRFWTKPRIRFYAITVVCMVVSTTGTCFLVLAGVWHDGAWARGFVLTGAGLALASLLFRIIVEIINATDGD